MNTAHELILLGGALGLISVFAGVIGPAQRAIAAGLSGPSECCRRKRTRTTTRLPIFSAAYLTGSIALAIILFEGGLKTERAMIRLAVWPSAVLAKFGVVVTAGIVAGAAVWLSRFHGTKRCSSAPCSPLLMPRR